MGQGAANQLLQLVGVEWFFDVVEGPVAHGFDRRVDGSVSGDHQHLRAVPAAGQMLDELQAVHAGHLQVGDDHVETLLLQPLEGFDGAGEALHLVARLVQHVGHRMAGLRVVVHDQDAAEVQAGFLATRFTRTKG